MNASSPIKVLLVDDHTMVRRGLATFLQVFDDLQLVGEAANGAEAIEKCDSIRPDVVLMDTIMPEMDGIDATQAIRSRFPSVQVIALTSFKEQELVHKALQAGAIGYLLKDVSADELAQAIRAAHAGRGTFSPEAVQALARAASEPPPLAHDLTDREEDVLALMIEGLTNIEIAEKLVVSPSTIKSHVSNILAKLDVSSRTEAVAFALQHRIFD